MAQLAIYGGVTPAESDAMDPAVGEAFLDAVGAVKNEEAEAAGERRQQELEFMADVIQKTAEGVQRQMAKGFEALMKQIAQKPVM